MRSVPPIRTLGNDDVEIVHWVLYRAIGWDPEVTLPPLTELISHPDLLMYHEEWGRHGDFGVAAEQDGELLGAAFARLFTDDTHGAGYIDESTPELGVAVADGHRGEGLGSVLLDALASEARAVGMKRLGLSVQQRNPARRLYGRLGYREVRRGDTDLVMVLELDTTHS